MPSGTPARTHAIIKGVRGDGWVCIGRGCGFKANTFGEGLVHMKRNNEHADSRVSDVATPEVVR